MRVTAVKQRENAGRKLPPPCANEQEHVRVARWSLPPSRQPTPPLLALLTLTG